MRWRRYGLVALCVVLATAGTTYLFCKRLILHFVATVGRDTQVVAPHREITWDPGPETAAAPLR